MNKCCVNKIIMLPLCSNNTINTLIYMKEKIQKLASCILIVILALTFHSCEDDEIAQQLDGIWEGEVASTYFSHRFGERTEYQYVDIEFYADPYRYAKGTGIEYDYYGNSYYYSECSFSFEVRNGIIYLDYQDGTSVAIRNYRLNGSRFSGDFIDYWSGDYLASFNFVKVNNWRYNRSYRSGENTYKLIPNPAQKKK